VHHQPGVKEIHRKTPTGETIVAAVDFIEGKGIDRRALNGYIQDVVKRWENTNQFYAQVEYQRFYVFFCAAICDNTTE